MKEIILNFTNISLLSLSLVCIILVFRRTKNKKIWLILFVIYVLLLPTTSNSIVRAWYLDDTMKDNVSYDAVVVLTGFTHRSWHLSDRSKLLPNYTRFGNAEGFRIGRSVELVLTKKAHQLFIGDLQNGDYSEAKVLKSFALKNGVSADNVIIYGNNVRGSKDEARQFSKYIKDKHIKSIILVTSAVHMRRVNATFRKHGVHADLVSINRGSLIDTGYLFIPKSNSITKYERILFEIAAYFGYYIKGDI